MNPDNRKARQLLKKYLRGQCTPAEIEMLHRWYDELPDLSPSIVEIESVGEGLQEAVWNTIGHRSAPVRRIGYRVAAAAVLIGVLIVSGIYWFSREHHPHWNEVINQTAGVRRVVLPDSSTAWINSHTRLRYTDDFGIRDRAVVLDGEAWFDIVKKPGIPFSVRSKDLLTEVLGTAFNVECYKEEQHVRVALATGSVRLVPADGKGRPIVLKPGEVAQLDEARPGVIAVGRGDAGSYDAWTRGGFILQDVPLEDALRRLCNKYGYTLNKKFSKNSNKPITVAYRNDSFEEILSGLLYINHLSYSIRDSVITVY